MKLRLRTLLANAALSLIATYATLVAATEAETVPAAAPAPAPPGTIFQPAASEIESHCNQGLAATQAQIKKLEQLPLAKVNGKTVLGGWNQMAILLENLDGTMALLAETNPDAAVRKAAEACNLKIDALPNQYLQSAALYARVKAVRAKDPIDAAARQYILEEFEARGVALPPAQRERAKVIFELLDKVVQDFLRNVREVSQKLAFSDADLKGVPPDALKGRAKDSEGRWIFGMDYPENDAIMENAELESTRRTYWMAFNQRGGKQNLALLNQAATLRRELASLMGVDNFADWAIKRKMAGDAKQVNQFLADVEARVALLEKNELAELSAEKAKLTGKADAQVLSWDVRFYSQRLKKSRYLVDQEMVRAQFPIKPTIDWLLKVSSTLYGVEFKENKQLKTWQEDVRGFDVFDTQTGAYRASFYLDLFPREGKYKNGAAFQVRGGSRATGRTPILALVTNFNRHGFSQRELETVFHEFGHIMHGVLSRTRYVYQSGAQVKRDFGEAPSQMYEEWSRRPESLALFAQACPSCKPIDTRLMARMNATRAFGKGIYYAWQCVLARWDMALHGAKAVDPMEEWISIEGKTPLGYIDGSMYIAAFGHVLRGYSAGYYGYMWSEVLMLDMLSPFGDNVMDVKVGARYRKMILERGSEVHPAQLMQAFLGRKPSSEAFFKEIIGQRAAQGSH